MKFEKLSTATSKEHNECFVGTLIDNKVLLFEAKKRKNVQQR